MRLLEILPYLVSGWLALVGLYGIATSRHLVHLVGCVAVVQSSTYVILLALSFQKGRPAPMFQQTPPGTPATDPVLHSLVLTDVVVGVTVTAFLLALVVQAYKRYGTADPRAITRLRG